MRQWSVRVAAVWVLLLAFATNLGAVVSVVCKPSTVSNTYSGVISLTITNIKDGETIYLDRYLDLNGKTTANTGEPLTARFEVTDGRFVGIGDVPNSAVPVDQDSARNSQIIVSFPFRGLDEAGRIAGLQRFRVTSSASVVETSLLVTQAPMQCSISGTVFTGTKPETNAVLTLLTLQDEFVSSAVADGKGNYTLYSDIGEYQLLVSAPGRPSVGALHRFSFIVATRLSGINITNTVSSRTISGALHNGTTGKGLPGVQLLALSTDGMGVIGYSDSTGAFSLPVTPGTWKLIPSALRLGQLNCNAPRLPVVVDTTLRSASTNLTFPAATSIVFGSLSGPSGEPLPGVAIIGTNSQSTARVVTDANGAFSTGVVTAPDWYWQPDPVALQRMKYVSTRGLYSIPTNGTWRIDFFARPTTARIRGSVTQEDGTAVSDLPLGFLSLEDVVGADTTKPDGSFDLRVCAGDWAISANPADLSSRYLLQPGATNYAVADGQDLKLDLVFRQITSKLTVNVHDTNAQPVPLVLVNCEAILDGVPFVVVGATDWSGKCSVNLCDGQWAVSVQGLESIGLSSPSPQSFIASSSTATISFEAYPPMPLAITTATLPPALVGTPYSFQLQAMGGTAPYLWLVTAGRLPMGLSLDSSGLILGIPTSSTNETFSVVVQDNNWKDRGIDMRDLSLSAAYPISLNETFDKSGKTFKFQISGEVNRSYVLERAGKITGPWRPFMTNRLTSPLGVFATVPTTNSPVFYRVRMDF